MVGRAPYPEADPGDALYDLYLLKTDSSGDTLWTRTYGGALNEVGKCVHQTQDGGYIIIGYRNGPTDPPPWPAGDLWLIKTDSQGYIEWDRTYGGSYYSTGNWVEQTSDGGYIVTGHYIGAYLWLLKTDNNGNKDWEKTYDWGPGSQAGYCIRELRDGGYIVSGRGGLLKTDENGDSVWLKLWGGRCVVETSDSGYVLTAHAGPGWGDLWVGKVSINGDSIWTRLYGGGQEEYGYEVQQTKDDGYIIIGTTNSFGAGNFDIWLLKLDSSGDTLWTRLLGGERLDGASSVQQTSDGGYIMTGFSSSYGGGLLLIKTDSLGYVGVAESPITNQPDWKVVNPIGSHIILHYTDQPHGFKASIYDACGRKVDEIHAAESSAMITWGECYGPGVYFIVPLEASHKPRKVLLVE